MQLAPRRWRITALKEMGMIDFYTCATPNGQKIHIMLEETGLEYSEHWIDIDKGDQFAPGQGYATAAIIAAPVKSP